MRKLVSFLFAGGVGFATDIGLLMILLKFTPLGPFSARPIAIFVAMCVTWAINRTITFGRSRHGLLTEGARYGGVGLASALLNYLIYASVLFFSPNLFPPVAVVIASFGAMVFSWAGYSRFVFQK